MVNYKVAKIIKLHIQNNNILNVNIKFSFTYIFLFFIPSISTEEDFLSAVELLNASVQNHLNSNCCKNQVFKNNLHSTIHSIKSRRTGRDKI